MPLRLNDILLQQLLYLADDNGLELVYAAIQQFGGTTSPKSMIPGREIPSRPFLGLSQEDEGEVMAILLPVADLTTHQKII